MSNKEHHLLRTTSLGLLLTMVIVAMGSFALVYRGVTVTAISVSGVRVEQISLRWQGKLVLAIDRILVSSAAPVSEPAKETAPGMQPTAVRKLLDAIKLIEKLFAKIDIRDIQVAGLQAQFSYREAGKGQLLVSGPAADIDLAIHLADDILVLDIQQLELPQAGASVAGWLQVDTSDSHLQAELSVLLADTLPLSVTVEADRKQLTFTGRGETSISDITPVVDLFGLSATIRPWLTDYLSASDVSLQTISGSMPYSEPAKILQTLHAELLVKDVEYTFAQGLEPARAPQVRVVFEQGILSVYPDDATFYGQHGGSTYVDIDFNGGRFLLTVFVRTRAQASGGVLTLLDHYGIPFPFEQIAGLTDSKLDLTIDLATKEIGASGHFVAADSVFSLGKQQFEVASLDAGLRTTLVLIRELDLAIPGLVTAKVEGVFDTATARGELGIDVDSFAYQPADKGLVLQANAQTPLHLDYEFRPTDDYLQVGQSSWRYGDLPITVDAFSTPFDPLAFSGQLSGVTVVSQSVFKALVSGRFQGSSPYADLHIGVLELGEPGRKPAAQGLQLAQPRADLEVNIGSGVVLSTAQTVALSYNGIPIVVQPSQMQYTDAELIVDDSRFAIGEWVSSGLSGNISLSQGLARLHLSDFQIASADGEDLFAPTDDVTLDFAWNSDFLQANTPALALTFERSNAGFWALELDDIAKLTPHSPLLQHAEIDEGSLRLSSRTGGFPFTFTGAITSPFGLIVLPNRTGVSQLRLAGSYDGREVNLDINKKIQIKWRDSVRISSADVGYSWPALQRVLKRLPGKDAASSADSHDAFKLSMQARGSFIVIDDERDLPLDAFSMRYSQGKAAMKFYHRGGFGTLDFSAGKLYLAGKNFSDKFFNDVMTLADFDGGRMEFSVEGTLDDMQAVFRIEDTIIKDYKHLNNMLAFVNTIPGLITFNPPGYNQYGLPAREAYAGLHYSAGKLHLESLKIESDELTLMGTGYIDFNNNTTDMDFNLVSGAKKSLNRIPLLGYILTGGEKQPSIMLKVEGDLYDPEISNTAFREVVTYPFQVLKRTVLLPVHIANELQNAEPAEDDKADK